jgi:DNA ligase-1
VARSQGVPADGQHRPAAGQSDAWREIKFLVFDAPGHGGGFEARVQHYHPVHRPREAEFARAHPHEPCRGVDHLRGELKRVEALGGEGLMLRRPGSRTRSGARTACSRSRASSTRRRGWSGIRRGPGATSGRLGGAAGRAAKRHAFAVGSGLSDAERGDPPPVGSIITFRYQELSDGGVPRFPTYVGVRHDVVWKPGRSAAQVAPRPARRGK